MRINEYQNLTNPSDNDSYIVDTKNGTYRITGDRLKEFVRDNSTASTIGYGQSNIDEVDDYFVVQNKQTGQNKKMNISDFVDDIITEVLETPLYEYTGKGNAGKIPIDIPAEMANPNNTIADYKVLIDKDPNSGTDKYLATVKDLGKYILSKLNFKDYGVELDDETVVNWLKRRDTTLLMQDQTDALKRIPSAVLTDAIVNAVRDTLNSIYEYKGTVNTVNDLPMINASLKGGEVYNIRNAFTINSNFLEYEAGNTNQYPAGTNVAFVKGTTETNGKWDCLSGAAVFGVKGGSELNYRTGNVNLDRTDIVSYASTNAGTNYNGRDDRVDTYNISSPNGIYARNFRDFSEIMINEAHRSRANMHQPIDTLPGNVRMLFWTDADGKINQLFGQAPNEIALKFYSNWIKSNLNLSSITDDTRVLLGNVTANSPDNHHIWGTDYLTFWKKIIEKANTGMDLANDLYDSTIVMAGTVDKWKRDYCTWDRLVEGIRKKDANNANLVTGNTILDKNMFLYFNPDTPQTRYKISLRNLAKQIQRAGFNGTYNAKDTNVRKHQVLMAYVSANANGVWGPADDNASVDTISFENFLAVLRKKGNTVFNSYIASINISDSFSICTSFEIEINKDLFRDNINYADGGPIFNLIKGYNFATDLTFIFSLSLKASSGSIYTVNFAINIRSDMLNKNIHRICLANGTTYNIYWYIPVSNADRIIIRIGTEGTSPLKFTDCTGVCSIFK